MLFFSFLRIDINYKKLFCIYFTDALEWQAYDRKETASIYGHRMYNVHFSENAGTLFCADEREIRMKKGQITAR